MATATPVPDPQEACADLSGRSIGGADVDSVELVETPNGTEYCQVLATIPPRLGFGVRLPTDWNQKTLFVGGGLLNGVINTPEQAVYFNPGLSDSGYAIIATDSGHQGSILDGSWALGDPDALEDFAFRSIHSALLAARAIVEERYGSPAVRSYWMGQSSGGREGLIAAQRWPEDFDGIVALAPVAYMVSVLMRTEHDTKQIFLESGGYLSAPEIALVGSAVLDRCDGLDGLEDGIVGDPLGCDFDPEDLRCTGESTDGCLTAAQIDSVNAVYSDVVLDFDLANGVRSVPGRLLGGEDGPAAWAAWVFGPSPEVPLSPLFRVSGEAIKYFLTEDPDFDPLVFEPADWEQEIVALSRLLDSTDPDLSEFASRGGKLILWHGLADHAISAANSMRYYETVVREMGEEEVDRFMRFYTSPGADHTNTGPGPSTIDFLSALEAWVEEGSAPDELVAFKLDQQGELLLSRPVCRYPDYPHYPGDGDPTLAESFDCVAP